MTGNDRDNNVEGDAVEGPLDSVSREEMVQAMREMKNGKASGPSDESAELITACEEVGIEMLVK